MTENQFISAVKRNNQRLFLIAFSYLQSKEDAEDVLQNSFAKLWNCKKEFEDSSYIDKWLTRVCINECKDTFKQLFRKHTSLEEAYDISTFDSYFNIDLFNAVLSLPKKERIVVHLFYYEDMSIADISALLKIKESTIKSLLHRSRKKLKQMLGDEWINE